MDSQAFEERLRQDVENIFHEILKNFNFQLDISAKSRSGAEISDYLEDAFVAYFKKNVKENFANVSGAPKGKTKNPFDFKFDYSFKDDLIEVNNELIWADIKACKRSYKDSNPDIGTPSKIIKYMQDGHFYLIYVLFEYEATEDNKSKFVKFDNDKYVKVVFLKNIHHSVRVNPKPQLQVNFKMSEEYRTQKEFVELLEKKYNESLERIIDKVGKVRTKIKKEFKDILSKM